MSSFSKAVLSLGVFTGLSVPFLVNISESSSAFSLLIFASAFSALVFTGLILFLSLLIAAFNSEISVVLSSLNPAEETVPFSNSLSFLESLSCLSLKALCSAGSLSFSCSTLI